MIIVDRKNDFLMFWYMYIYYDILFVRFKKKCIVFAPYICFLFVFNSNTNQIVILPSMHNAEKEKESELGTKACTLNEPSVSDSRPKKRKKISIDELQRMQYEVTK